MPRFLPGLFGDTPKNDLTNPIPRVVSTSRSQAAGVAGFQTWDLEQAVRQGYERVIWVFRCVDAIASNSSSLPLVVRKHNDLSGDIWEDPDLAKVLNRRPNAYETSQQFRYRLAAQSLLSRRGAFVEVVRNNAGRPTELHLLNNSNVRVIPHTTKFVERFDIMTDSGTVSLSPEDVLWIRVKPHPTDPYSQMTPLVAAGLAADTDYLARLYNRNFLLNDGRPGMIVSVSGDMEDEDARELKARFGGGPSQAGRTTVISADGVSAVDTSANPRDVGWQSAVQGSKDDILLSFGVPVSVLGDASGRTFDNADAEWANYWEATMVPFCDGLAAGFDSLTIGGITDDFLVSHNYDGVDVLQRHKRDKESRALGQLQVGAITMDDYRDTLGLPRLDIPATRVLWMPPGNVPVGMNDKDTKDVQKLLPVGVPPSGGDQFAQSQAGAQAGAALGTRNFLNIQAARAMQLSRKSDNTDIESDATPKLALVKEPLPFQKSGA